MRYRILATLLLITLLAPAFAADVFYDVPLGDLKLAQGSKWPGGAPPQNAWGQTLHASVDAPAEAYVVQAWQGAGNITRLAVRVPQGQKVSGIVAIPAPSQRNAAPAEIPVLVHFTIDPAGTSEAPTRTAFYRAKEVYYTDLLQQGIPGAAWFRHQANLARQELGEKQPAIDQAWQRGGGRVEDNMYDLFSGGRAVAENLQLDRALMVRGDAKDDVKVDSIVGITVSEMDFLALLKGVDAKTDTLARYVPFDQYAVFFPTFPAVLDVMDRVEHNTVPVIQNMLPQSSDAGYLKRYQTQIGLHASGLARLLGPQLVKSVAVTGSDTSFAMGTDFAILFESPNATATQALLLAQIARNTASVKGVRAITENIEGLGSAQGFLTDDRTVSSYIARIDDTVIVTNSLVQLRKLADLKAAKIKPLAQLPEYLFFRSRYEIGKGNETAFLVISDATIRKWCSARWRIGDALRIGELAADADRVAQHVDLMLTGEPLPAGATSMPKQVQPGDAQKTPQTAILPTLYKPNGFQKPVAEMEFDTVTKAQADAYSQWRDGYQRNWSGVFDPIALRIALDNGKMGGDLTIMPLIGNTDYRQFINLTNGAALSAGDGDPHDALWHAVFAINRESQTARNWSDMGKTMLPGVKIDPLGWLGQAVALYADDDPYWKELAVAKNPEQFMQNNLGRLPIALQAQASSPLKLAVFISAIRALIEQSAPGLTTWQPQEYNGKTYVKITSAQGIAGENFSIYYAALPDSLTITLNENVIKHALDRAAAATQPATAQVLPAGATAQPATSLPATRPWLGKNLAAQVRSGSMDLFSRLAHDEFGRQLQRRSWNNLPILNEWKRLYTDKDPVAVHQQVWAMKLLCPAGGQYVWNKDVQTMESTVVGCPEAPKPAPESLLQFRGINFANFGLTFENQGLRAQVELDVAAPK